MFRIWNVINIKFNLIYLYYKINKIIIYINNRYNNDNIIINYKKIYFTLIQY